MEITVEEMLRLPAEDYMLVDMRNEEAREYGVIPGAAPISQEELESNPPETEGKKLILYCARGQFSLDAAEALREKGVDAYSLRGGYIEWLRDQMERQQADELCQRVENSLRKKFREKLWCNFTKAVRDYELVKSGDRIFAYFIGEGGVRARKFTIQGIYQTNLSQYDKVTCFCDLYTARKLNGWTDDLATGAELTVKDFSRLGETAEVLVNRVNRTSDAYGNTYSTKTIRDLSPQIFSWLDLLDLNVWIILAIMTAVAVVTMIRIRFTC